MFYCFNTRSVFFVCLFLCSSCTVQAQDDIIEPSFINPRTGAASADLSDEEIAEHLKMASITMSNLNFAAGFGTFSGFLKKIDAAKTYDAVYRNLELTPEQEDSLAKLNREFEGLISAIDDNAELSESERKIRKRILEKSFLSKVRNNLEKFQVLELRNWNTSAGLPKMLILSGYGESVGLTAEQKKRIQDKSQKLIEDFSTAIREFRQHSAELVFEELTEVQRRKLAERIDMKAVNDVAERATVRQILRMHNFADTELTFEKFLNAKGEVREYSLRIWPEEKKAGNNSER